MYFLTSFIKIHNYISYTSDQFSSVAQSCLTLCDPMNCSTPGHPVHNHLLEFTQTHVHQVGDAIHPSHHLLSSPPPPALNPSKHQGLFQWGGQSTGVSASASVLPKSTQDWSPLKWTGWISTTNRNVFESVLMRWMNLETIIQSKVSQKEKNIYLILMHIRGI